MPDPLKPDWYDIHRRFFTEGLTISSLTPSCYRWYAEVGKFMLTWGDGRNIVTGNTLGSGHGDAPEDAISAAYQAYHRALDEENAVASNDDEGAPDA